jgi:hypothetical protein
MLLTFHVMMDRDTSMGRLNIADTSNKVEDKKPSLNKKVFEVVDQKLIKAAIRDGSGLI